MEMARWAEKRGNQRIFGHKNAIAAVRDTVEAAAELGIDYLTLYAFSTENWKRPKIEIDALMSLLVSTIHSETKTLTGNNIRLLTIGNTESLPQGVQEQLQNALDITATKYRIETCSCIKLWITLGNSACR